MTNFWKLCTLSLPTESGSYEVRVSEKDNPLSCPITTQATYDKETNSWCVIKGYDLKYHEVIAWR